MCHFKEIFYTGNIYLFLRRKVELICLCNFKLQEENYSRKSKRLFER